MRLDPERDVRVAGLTRLRWGDWPAEDVGRLPAAQGQTLRVVVACRHRFPIRGLRVSVEPAFGPAALAFPLGMVPFPEQSTVIPDPVCEEELAEAQANATTSFLARISIPPDLPPGEHAVRVRVSSKSHGDADKAFTVAVCAARQPDGVELGDSIFWPHWNRLSEHYGVDLWSEPFWALAEKYLREMADGGMTGLAVFVSEDPHRYPLPPEIKRLNRRPGMIGWLRRKDGSFHFDYSVYDRYVALGTRLGIDREIQCLAMLPCKLQKPVLTYFDEGQGETVSVETSPDAADYRDAWGAFLRDFAAHNEAKGWRRRLSLVPYDEPRDPALFARMAALARECAPGLLIAAACDKDAHALAGALDRAAVNLGVLRERPSLVQDLRARGIEPQWYNCMSPVWGNTLFASPLAEAWRMSWITKAGGLAGYLRWAIINWTDDPWHQPAFNWPTGDMFLLYPGKTGPASSLRWEAYKAGRSDLAVYLANRRDEGPDALLAELGSFEPAPEPADVTAWRWRLFEKWDASAQDARDPALRGDAVC